MRTAIASLFFILSLSLAAQAGTKTFTVEGDFDSVAFELEQAVVNRGLVIDTKGDVSGMLARTGQDVGAKKDLYVGARYLAFCSAVLSRKMMEADASTMGLCPYVVFAYETKAEPGKVVVGYRIVNDGRDGAAKPVLEEIDTWLESIVKEVADN